MSRGSAGFSEAVRLKGLAARQAIAASRLADYLLIGGQDMPAAEAARRVGVCERTIVRYRARLRAGA